MPASSDWPSAVLSFDALGLRLRGHDGRRHQGLWDEKLDHGYTQPHPHDWSAAWPDWSKHAKPGEWDGVADSLGANIAGLLAITAWSQGVAVFLGRIV